MALNTIYMIPISSPDLFSELQIHISDCLFDISLEFIRNISNLTCPKQNTWFHPSPSWVCSFPTVNKDRNLKDIFAFFSLYHISLASQVNATSKIYLLHLHFFPSSMLYYQSPSYHHISLRHHSSLLCPHFQFWPLYKLFSSQLPEWLFKNANQVMPLS